MLSTRAAVLKLAAKIDANEADGVEKMLFFLTSLIFDVLMPAPKVLFLHSTLSYDCTPIPIPE